jgi:putative transposase
VSGLSVRQGCGFMGISRQAYYQAEQARVQRRQHAQVVLELVRDVRLEQPRIGTRKLHYLLRGKLASQSIKLGRDGMFALLKEHRMLVVPKRAYHKTTMSHHRFYKHPNLLKHGPGQVIPQAPEQVWVSDITYLPTREETTYLSLVTDAYSRKIVGYHLERHMQTKAVGQALKMALKQRTSDGRLVHHSDRGIQYCSAEYQRLHEKHGVTCSMTDGYDCYQNALAERVNGILKEEFMIHKPKNLEEARQMVKESIRIYNEKRPHLSLKYKTPDEVHRAFRAT